MKKSLVIGAAALVLLGGAAAGGTALALARMPEESALVAVETAVLRQGSTGGEVQEVQRRLRNWGYYSGAVDGIFGAGTRRAVIAFQQKNGLTADGVVGMATYKALGMNDSYRVLAGQDQGGQAKKPFHNRRFPRYASRITHSSRPPGQKEDRNMADIRASAASERLQTSEEPPASADLREPSAGAAPQAAPSEENDIPSLPPLFAPLRTPVPRTSPP